jgi:hypothetical protein
VPGQERWGDSVATDYDAPRNKADDELAPEAELAAQSKRSAADASLGDDVDPFELELDPNSADLTDEDLTVRVLPKQADEFTCSVCYLVHHRSQRAGTERVQCRDCAA